MDVKTLLQQLGFLAPEVALTGLILLLIVGDILLKREKRPLGFFALVGTLLVLALTLKAWEVYPANVICKDAPGGIQSIFQGAVVFDAFGLFFKVLFLGAAVLIILMSQPVVARWKSGQGETWVLMLSCTLGMMFMATANDLLMMYLALEFVSITSYIMAGLQAKNRKSAEASLKYIIYGAAASGMMIYGMSFLYGITGTLQIDQVGARLMESNVPPTMALVISVLVMAGFAYKIAAAPFHMWCPDVYEGAPTPVTAFFSVGPKAAGFAMLVRFIAGVYQTGSGIKIDNAFEWNVIIAIVAVMTMAVGNLAALQQQNLKRLMAYSSIGHAGYMLLAFTVFEPLTIASVLFYLVVYAIMNLGAFAVVIVLEDRYGVETVEQCRGMGWKAPGLCALMTLFMVSLTGLPPTAGFTGKMLLFGRLIETNRVDAIGLVVVGVLFSVVSLFYYARIIGAMFLVKPRDEGAAVRVPLVYQGILWALALGTVWFGFFPGGLMDLTRETAKQIFPRI